MRLFICMNFTMKLHYRLQESAQPENQTLPVLLIHGLFKPRCPARWSGGR